MKIILLKKIRGKAHKIGDIVEVKDGYALNYLLPKGFAVRATKINQEQLAHKRAELEEQNTHAFAAATDLASKIKGLTVIIERQSGDDGRLYGSVSSYDIADAVNAAVSDVGIDHHSVEIIDKIKSTGVYTVFVSTHADVRTEITVNVVRQESKLA